MCGCEEAATGSRCRAAFRSCLCTEAVDFGTNKKHTVGVDYAFEQLTVRWHWLLRKNTPRLHRVYANRDQYDQHTVIRAKY